MPDNANESILYLVKPGMKVCEIGVRSGESSLAFLEAGAFLYMVDPWEAYPEYSESACYNFPDDYQKSLERVAHFPGKYKIIRKKSDDALADVPDDLDFVYIDANHAYDFVKRDMENWWPKITQGGWLTGDDYEMPEVKRAVNEFVESKEKEWGNLPLCPFGLNGRNWIIMKP